MYPFENLKAWKESVILVEIIYKESAKFPKDERFSLVDQLKKGGNICFVKYCRG